MSIALAETRAEALEVGDAEPPPPPRCALGVGGEESDADAPLALAEPRAEPLAAESVAGALAERPKEQVGTATVAEIVAGADCEGEPDAVGGGVPLCDALALALGALPLAEPRTLKVGDKEAAADDEAAAVGVAPADALTEPVAEEESAWLAVTAAEALLSAEALALCWPDGDGAPLAEGLPLTLRATLAVPLSLPPTERETDAEGETEREDSGENEAEREAAALGEVAGEPEAPPLPLAAADKDAQTLADGVYGAVALRGKDGELLALPEPQLLPPAEREPGALLECVGE